MDILKSRVSLHQRHMTGGEVKESDIKKAFIGITSVPVHGKLKPYRYVVFSGDKVPLVYDTLYSTLESKYSLDSFKRYFVGVGAFIFIFCKRLESRVPFYEHEWSTVCATYVLHLNFYSMGYGVKWNSIMKESEDSKLFLDLCCLTDDYSTMGYLMVGTGELEFKEREDYNDYVIFK